MLKNIDVEAVKAFMIIFIFVGSMFCLFRFSKYLKNQITFDSLFYRNLVPFVLLIVLGFVLIIILIGILVIILVVALILLVIVLAVVLIAVLIIHSCYLRLLIMGYPLIV